MVDNADWLDALHYIPFLREIGRHLSVNRMLGFDSVRLRLDRHQPLSFLEFNYMVLQAYDFVELARRHDCILQMGGSDQWGNIVSGIELGHRLDRRQLYGLTAPLITTGAGTKMGKTAEGAVLAQPGADGALRLLAVLAQYGRCGCRPLPAPVYRSGGARPSGPRSARRRRNQRGQAAAGGRGHPPGPRAGRRGQGRRDRAPDLRGGRHRRGPAHAHARAGRARGRHSHLRAIPSGRAVRDEGRGTTPGPRRRRAPERRGHCGRDRDGERGAAEPGRRHHAVRREEASRGGAPYLNGTVYLVASRSSVSSSPSSAAAASDGLPKISKMPRRKPGVSAAKGFTWTRGSSSGPAIS